MKKCPFCAEEIQDAAIKCRYCQSFLSMAPATAESTPGTSASVPKVAPVVEAPVVATPKSPALTPAISSKEISRESSPSVPKRNILYSGSPSWRAYFDTYFLLALAGLVMPYLTYWIAGKFNSTGFAHLLSFVVPLGIVAAAIAIVHYYRRSKVFRVTANNIEIEHGFFSKKIDVLELWRCRDIQYRQSLFDRIVRIAHIDIFTTDVTTPNVCIAGLPASRELFENIRDAIEIQRQSKNVLGMIQ